MVTSKAANNLAHLPHLPGAGGGGPPLGKLPRPPRVPSYIEALPPTGNQAGDVFNSSWERWLAAFLFKKDPYWVSQQQFGRVGFSGATRPDFIEPLRKIALYVDGPSHTIWFRVARDTVLRASLLGLGYRVVVWTPKNFDDLVRNAERWYARDLGGGSI